MSARFIVIDPGAFRSEGVRHIHHALTLCKTYWGARRRADESNEFAQKIRRINEARPEGRRVDGIYEGVEEKVYLFDPANLLEVIPDPNLTPLEMHHLSDAEFAERQVDLWAARAAAMIESDKPHKVEKVELKRNPRRARCTKCELLKYPEQLVERLKPRQCIACYEAAEP